MSGKEIQGFFASASYEQAIPQGLKAKYVSAIYVRPERPNLIQNPGRFIPHATRHASAPAQNDVWCALNAHTVFSGRNAVTCVGKNVIRRALPEFIARTQLMADIETKSGNAERDRGPSDNSQGRAIFTRLQKDRHFSDSSQTGPSGQRHELHAVIIYRFHRYLGVKRRLHAVLFTTISADQSGGASATLRSAGRKLASIELAASSRRCSAVKSNSVYATRYSFSRSLSNIAGSSELSVIIKPASK